MNISQQISGWMEPLWQGNHVTDECVLFTQNSPEQSALACRLLYKPDKLFEVRSDYLDLVFEEGRDYYVEDDLILRSANSRIPFFRYDELFLSKPASIPINSSCAPGRYVRYEAGGVETLKRQIKVSYTHLGDGSFLRLPRGAQAFLPRSLEKLTGKQAFKIVFYGDSVMEGCDASGRTGLAPYMPPIDRLAVYKLADWYAHSKLHFVNTSVGGTMSQWGLENLKSRVLDQEPDLTILHFGVNDCSSGKPAADCAANLHAMAQLLRRASHQSEVLILTGDLPSADCNGWMGTNKDLKQAIDQEISNEDGTAVLQMRDLFEQLCTIKGYYSLTTNFVNHPNDFMIRLYAQLLCSALGVYQ